MTPWMPSYRLSHLLTDRVKTVASVLLVPALALVVFSVGMIAGQTGILVVSLAVVCSTAAIVFAFRRRSWSAHANNELVLLAGATWVSMFVVRWEPAPFDLLVLILLAWWLIKSRFVIPLRPSLVILVVGCGSLTVSHLLSFWNTPSLFISARFTLASVLVYAVAFVSYLLALDAKLLRTTVIAYVIGAVVSTAAILAIVMTGLPLRSMLVMFGSRVMGLTKDPNVFAPYLIVAFVLLLALPDWSGEQVDEPLWMRTAWIGSLLVLAVGVLVAYSRAGWVNFVLTLTMYWALRSLASKATAQRIVMAILVIVPVALVLISRIQIPQDSVLAERIRPQAYDQERFSTQAKSIEAFWDSPILGHGPGMSNELLEVATHNSYLRILYENGIFGLIAFAVLLLGATWLSLRASQMATTSLDRRIAAAVCAALVGMIISSFVIDSVHWRHLWMTIGVGWASGQWVLERPSKPGRAVQPHRETVAGRLNGSAQLLPAAPDGRTS